MARQTKQLTVGRRRVGVSNFEKILDPWAEGRTGGKAPPVYASAGEASLASHQAAEPQRILSNSGGGS